MPTSYHRFVALGDSFTEGLEDRGPDGEPRGWADRVAIELAAAEPDFRYANLAVRSRRLDQIAAEQLEVALAMRPDLVSIAAGGNDILGVRFDAERAAAGMVAVVETLAASGATVVVFAGFDPRPRLPFGRRLAARTAAYNDVIRRTVVAHDAVLVDLWAMTELRDSRMWAPDRLHFSALGHAHIAAAVLAALGRPGRPGRATDDGAGPAPGRLTRWRADAGWGYEHLLPWAIRKARGRSMGDGRGAKRPELAPVELERVGV